MTFRRGFEGEEALKVGGWQAQPPPPASMDLVKCRAGRGLKLGDLEIEKCLL